MKKAYKYFSLLLALAALLSLLPVSALALTSPDDRYTYTVSDGEATITQYMGAGGEVILPSSLGGYPVTKIGERAFFDCRPITGVTIPAGVRSIGLEAFCSCNNLASIAVAEGNEYFRDIDGVLFNADATELIQYPGGKSGGYSIPDGVTSIRDYAFSRGLGISRVVIPGTVNRIGENAFSWCTSLYGVSMYNGVTQTGDYAFMNCINLTSISFPDSMLSIGKGTFSGCIRLMSVTIGTGDLKIGAEAFSGCDKLNNFYINRSSEYYSSKDGVLFNADATKLVLYPRGRNGAYVVPETVTAIGDQAFKDSVLLSEITLPAGLKTIGDYAFSGCSRIVGMEIPSSVTSVGSWAFGSCSNLESLTIPDATSYLGDHAFDNCRLLTVVTLGSSVRGIGDGTFSGCGCLTKVSIGRRVGSIGREAFSGCASLTDVYFEGTRERWDSIPVADRNIPLYDANLHFKDVEYCPAEDFTDVPEDSYYFGAVNWAAEKGITNGTSDTTFSPNDTVTRGQAVTFLWRAAGKPAPSGSKNPFKDVKKDAYYYSAVLWAVEKGITNGTSNTTFSPDAPVSRGQLVTFLWRVQGRPGDTGSQTWYADAVAWAEKNGVTEGTAEEFCVDARCPRSDVVFYLYNALT